MNSIVSYVTDGNGNLELLEGMRLSVRKFVVTVALVLTLGFVLPEIAYRSQIIGITTLATGVAFAIAAVGLNLLFRHTGLISFGHAAFYGSSAYAVAVAATHFEVNSLGLFLLIGIVTSIVLGVIIGLLSIRHQGIYFSLLTLAFAQLIVSFVISREYLNYSDGLAVRPEGGLNILGTSLSIDFHQPIVYLLMVGFLVLSLLLMWRLITSPWGKALHAIGQSRSRAEFIGIPVNKYVLEAFVISAAYSGIAGSLIAVFTRYVTPDTLGFFVSGFFLFAIILGGYKSLTGPVIGAMILIYIDGYGRVFTDYFDAAIGILLLVFIFLFSEGIMSSLQKGTFREKIMEFLH